MMLVLSRKKGERIRIGDDVEMVVLSISGNRVKLGFDGPAKIHRVESRPEGKKGADNE